MYKLLYAKEYVHDLYTPYKYLEVQGIEQYEGATLRGKVVFRIDILCLMQDIFTKETMSKCRILIYNLISGKINDKNLISNVFTALYKEDESFRRFLGDIVYFRLDTAEMSLYQYVVGTVKERYGELIEALKLDMSKTNCRFITDHRAYAYFAIDDADKILCIPEECEVEVISRAKNWNGRICRC